VLCIQDSVLLNIIPNTHFHIFSTIAIFFFFQGTLVQPGLSSEP
jgi:hypothetical protein